MRAWKAEGKYLGWLPASKERRCGATRRAARAPAAGGGENRSGAGSSSEQKGGGWGIQLTGSTGALLAERNPQTLNR